MKSTSALLNRKFFTVAIAILMFVIPFTGVTAFAEDTPMPPAPDSSIKLSVDPLDCRINQGNDCTITASFYEEQSSNAATLTYHFNNNIFDHITFTPASGVSVLNTSMEAGMVKITVITMEYGMKELGEIKLQSKMDAEFGNYPFRLDVEYVLKDGSGDKTIALDSALVNLIIAGPIGPITDPTLIDLSNMVDWHGIASTHPEWYDKYISYDFNSNGEIDISDISFLAKLIV